MKAQNANLAFQRHVFLALLSHFRVIQVERVVQRWHAFNKKGD